ncbi:MAG: DsrE family protein [Thermoplasmata archaeon]|nr:DsrE family protein [Thermoplasmata archaeon]
MAKILVMVLTGKSNIQGEMVAFNFSINAVKNANAEIEMLFLGQGVQAVNKKQANSGQFKEQISKAKEVGITLKACSVSIKNEGLTESDIFPEVELVLGGVETNKKIEEGYTVISF